MSNSAIIAMGAAIPSLPFVAVGIVGLIFSLSRRSRFPRGARWATVGFISLLLHVGMSFVNQYSFEVSEGPPEHAVHNLVWMTSLLYLLRLVSLVALTMAVFAERQPAKKITPDDVQNACS